MTPEEIGELRALVDRLGNTGYDKNLATILDAVIEHIDQQAARIKELEDALAEYQRLGKIMEGRLPCLTLHGECARCSSRAKELCDAMHQIAEGKIGPKDAKPRSWQITDERIATISASLKVLERLKKVNTDTDHCYLDAGIAVLRTMLGDGNCLTAADAAALVGPHGKEHAKKLLKNEHEEVDW
jgi:hypothetical protein